MYNRPGAFGPPVTGREPDSFARSTYGRKIGFGTNSSSYGTHAVRDSSNGFNPAFTPPYYDGHAVVDIIFTASATKEYTIAEIIRESETQSWRWDPGWLIRRVDGAASGFRLATTASFTLIPGEMYYHKDETDGLPGGITSSFGPAFSVSSGSADYTSNNDRRDLNTRGARLFNGAPYAGQHINETSMQLDNCLNLKLLGNIPAATTDNEGNLTLRNVPSDNDKIWVIQPKWETPVLNFRDATPFPQGEGLSTNGFGNLNLSEVRRVSSIGMWHQFGRIPENNEGIFLEMIDIPKNWLDGHWSLRKNMNRGDGIPQIGPMPAKPGDVSGQRVREVIASYGYNTPYTCSAYDPIVDSSQVQSLKDLLGFKSSAQSSNLTLAGPGIGPKVKIGELAELKVVSEAIVAIPFIWSK